MAPALRTGATGPGGALAGSCGPVSGFTYQVSVPYRRRGGSAPWISAGMESPNARATRQSESSEIDFSPRSTSPTNFPLSPALRPRRS